MTRRQLLLFALLVVAILLAGGWYFIVEQGKPIPATPPLTEGPVTPTQPGTTPIDTSDWKTYRNEEYKIEFKYPDNTLQIRDLSDSAGILYLYIFPGDRLRTETDEPGTMIIVLNDLPTEKYYAAKRLGKCFEIRVLEQQGEICNESDQSNEARINDLENFIRAGTCVNDVGFNFYKPVLRDEKSGGSINNIYLRCDKDNPKLIKLLQSVFQTVRLVDK